MNEEFGPILATRDLIWTGNDEKDRTAHLDIGVPKASDDPEPIWATKVRVRETGEDVTRVCYGADYLQSLFHAMAVGGEILKGLVISRRIDWFEVTDFGLPLPPVNDIDGDCGCH